MAAAAAAQQPGRRRVHRRMPRPRHQRGSDRDRREARLRHRPARRAPVHARRHLPGLDRQFRADGIRHRRDLRLPRPRPARHRVRPQIRSDRHPGRAAAGRGPGTASRSATRPIPAPARSSIPASSTGSTSTPAKRARHRARSSARAPAAASSTGGCAIGASAGSATGARRSRSSTAPPAARCRCPTPTCRWCCRSTSRSTGRAIRSTIIRPGSTSPAPPAAQPRSARPTRWTRSSTARGISPASAAPHAEAALERRGGRSLAAGRPVYRRHRARDPAPALRPLLHPRAAEAPARSGWPSRSPGCSPRAWSRTRPTGPRTATGSIRARSRCCRTGRRAVARPASAVAVGRVEKMSKSKLNTVDPAGIIDRYGADTARWFVLSDNPPDRDIEWTEVGRGRRVALHPARVPPGRRRRGARRWIGAAAGPGGDWRCAASPTARSLP